MEEHLLIPVRNEFEVRVIRTLPVEKVEPAYEERLRRWWETRLGAALDDNAVACRFLPVGIARRLHTPSDAHPLLMVLEQRIKQFIIGPKQFYPSPILRIR